MAVMTSASTSRVATTHKLERARPDLFQRSDAIGLRHLCGHLSLLALTAAALAVCCTTASALAGRCWPLAVLAHSVVLSHLYMPFHESTHGTAFESAWLCQLVAWPLGLLIFMNADSFKWFHREHHEFTQA